MEEKRIQRREPERGWWFSRILGKTVREAQEQAQLEEMGYQDGMIIEREDVYRKCREDPWEMLRWLSGGKLDLHFMVEMLVRMMLEQREK